MARRYSVLAAAGVLTLSAAIVPAAELTFSIGQNFGVGSNLQGAVGGNTGSSTSETTLNLGLKSETQVQTLDFNIASALTYASTKGGFKLGRPGFSLGYTRAAPRTQLSFNASYREQDARLARATTLGNVLTAQQLTNRTEAINAALAANALLTGEDAVSLSEEDVASLATTQGFTGSTITYGANVGLAFEASPRDTIRATLGFSGVDYSETNVSGSPRQTLSTGLTWSRSLTPRANGSASLNYAQTKSEDSLNTDSRRLTGRIGTRFEASQIATLTAGIGATFAQTEKDSVRNTPRDTQSTTKAAGDLGLTLTGVDNSLSLSFSRSVVPADAGGLENRTAFNARYAQELNSLTRMALSAGYSVRNDVSGGTDRTSLTAGASLTRDFSEDFSATLAYRATSADSGTGAAVSHALNLSFSRAFTSGF